MNLDELSREQLFQLREAVEEEWRKRMAALADQFLTDPDAFREEIESWSLPILWGFIESVDSTVQGLDPSAPEYHDMKRLQRVARKVIWAKEPDGSPGEEP